MDVNKAQTAKAKAPRPNLTEKQITEKVEDVYVTPSGQAHYPGDIATDIRQFNTGESLRKTFFDMKVFQFEMDQVISGPIDYEILRRS